MKTIVCPCCHGEKKLVVYEEGKLPGVDIPTFFVDQKDCAHCEGTGVIEIEVKEDGTSTSHG